MRKELVILKKKNGFNLAMLHHLSIFVQQRNFIGFDNVDIFKNVTGRMAGLSVNARINIKGENKANRQPTGGLSLLTFRLSRGFSDRKNYEWKSME